MSRLRWRVAGLLDRWSRLCWADLVTWALGWHGIREVSSEVPRCSTAPDGCYCGKYQPTDSAAGRAASPRSPTAGSATGGQT